MDVALRTIEGVPVHVGGNAGAGVDLWFLPAFGESEKCFREALSHRIAGEARIVLFDPPGFGAAPARAEGLSLDALSALVLRLVARISEQRPMAWVAHSMASIAAARAAAALGDRLRLLVSVEGNLTPADAFLTGQAARHPDAASFHAAFCAGVRERVAKGGLPERYLSSLLLADPFTLWTLGRSVVDCPDPGTELSRLGATVVYYWDRASVPQESRAFLAASALRQRRFDGCGHWPMYACTERFYDCVLEDLRAALR